ncbi:hypothetical protein ABPG75_010142 [Micractinium tetrahymenae]
MLTAQRLAAALPCRRALAGAWRSSRGTSHSPGSEASSSSDAAEDAGIAAAAEAQQHAAAAAAAGAASEPPPAHPLLQRILRTDLAAEEAAAALYRGQQRVLGRRPDLAAFQEREESHAAELRRLAPAHRTRPSLLSPALRAGFWALGAAAAAAPRPLGAAVTAGLQDALTDVCNEQLRTLREEGLAEAAPQVRHAVRAMRDDQREVEGAPPVPDILALQRLNELSAPEALAAVVKFGARTAIDLAGRV